MGVGYDVIWKCNHFHLKVIVRCIVIVDRKIPCAGRKKRQQIGDTLQIVHVVVVAVQIPDFAEFYELCRSQAAEFLVVE